MKMKEFSAFVRKEFYHIFRDKRTLLVIVGIPIVLITLFGFALSVEIRNINVGILAPQNEELIDRLEKKIDASEYFTVTEHLRNAEDIDLLMRKGKIDVALVFDNNFSGRMLSTDGSELALIVDASNPSVALSEVMYLKGVVQSYFMESMSEIPQLTGIMPNVRMLYNPQLKSSYNFVPGIMGLILILICALMTSVSIVREKETGTMEVLLVSPVKPTTIIFAKMIPYFVISCVILLIIFVLSYTLLQVPIAGSIFWIAVISMIYVMLSLAIGLLVSTLVSTQLTAVLVSAVLFMMPIIMFSGMIFPIESMPLFFQYLSQIIPAKWFILAIRKVMIEGLSVHYVLKEIVILLAMMVLIFTVALKKFNDRLE